MSIQWAQMIPLGAALIASLTALAIALQNRRWIRKDQDTERLRAVEDRAIAAQIATTRRAAEQAFDLLPSDCAAWMRSVTEPERELAAAVVIGMREVEPIRRWAYVLPLPWRLRIDGMASMLAHFGDAEAGAQLQRDIADLLNGHEAPGELDAAFANKFAFYLSALVGTERYKLDPATRELSKTLGAALWVIDEPDVIERIDGSGDVRKLLREVTGRRKLGVIELDRPSRAV